jgi:hypothetical protein
MASVSCRLSRKEEGKQTSSTTPGNLKRRARKHIRSEERVEEMHITGGKNKTDGVLIVNWADTPTTKRTAERMEKR